MDAGAIRTLFATGQTADADDSASAAGDAFSVLIVERIPAAGH